MKKKSPPDESTYLAKLREPEFVTERLTVHRSTLAEDLRLLRLWWPGYMHNVTFLKLDDPVGYLRSKLTIPEGDLEGKKTDSDNTLSARHRLALEYCRTLGGVGDAVDRLYQRIVSGDITDKRAVETEADDALSQLDFAIAKARAQWKAGGAVIKVNKLSEWQSEIEREAAEQRKRSPQWSISRSPSDWLKVFAKLNVDCRSISVFDRLRKHGTFHQHPESKTKSVRLDLADLPPDYSDNMTA